nr:carbohydrate sulfotransferase 11-like isoform X1 [Biomphalaria glabrata]
MRCNRFFKWNKRKYLAICAFTCFLILVTWNNFNAALAGHQLLQRIWSSGRRLIFYLPGIGQSFVNRMAEEKNSTGFILQRLQTRALNMKVACRNNAFMFYNETENSSAISSQEKSFFVNREHRLIYWAIPKVASSFWKRIFRVLDSSNKDGQTIFNITNMEAHLNVPQSMVFLSYSRPEQEVMLASYSKFFFVREPYSRLFSAYVDKLLIPNGLGKTLKKEMVKSGFLDTSRCIWNVSFAELCHYVANATLSGHPIDYHLKPISFQETCRFNASLLGHLETFTEDSRAILFSSNISISKISGHVLDLDSENELGYINDITARTMEVLNTRETQCLGRFETLLRLWKVFQIRGFISKTISFPFYQRIDKPESIKSNELVYAATQAYGISGPAEVRHRQREEAMLEAYAGLPEETLVMLEHSMSSDCTLLNYPCDIRKRIKLYIAGDEFF